MHISFPMSSTGSSLVGGVDRVIDICVSGGRVDVSRVSPDLRERNTWLSNLVGGTFMWSVQDQDFNGIVAKLKTFYKMFFGPFWPRNRQMGKVKLLTLPISFYTEKMLNNFLQTV